MRPDAIPPRHARGFGLVAALFLIIVVTLVVVAMARLSAVQHGSNSLAIQQARAYQAARAGLEWGISRAFNASAADFRTPASAPYRSTDSAAPPGPNRPPRKLNSSSSGCRRTSASTAAMKALEE